MNTHNIKLKLLKANPDLKNFSRGIKISKGDGDLFGLESEITEDQC